MRGAVRFGPGSLLFVAAMSGRILAQTPEPEDPPGTIQFSRATYSASESAGSAVLSVTRRDGGRGPVVVSYTVSDGTATAGADFTPVGGTVSWAGGDGAPRAIAVPIAADGVRESTETLTVTLRHVSGDARLGTPSVATLAIIDSGVVTPAIGTIEVADPALEVPESDDAFVTVSRRGDTTRTATVGWRLVPGTATTADYVPASGVLTFAPGLLTTRVRVAILNDALTEGPETLRFVLETPSAGMALGPTATTITIVDDDAGGGETDGDGDGDDGEGDGNGDGSGGGDEGGDAGGDSGGAGGGAGDGTGDGGGGVVSGGPYYVAEGATGFFDLEFALANPNPTPVPVTASFFEPGGAVTTVHITLPPMSRTTMRAADIPGLEDTAVSSVFDTGGVPIVVERTMTWNRVDAYGAHAERAGDGARRHWFFAEGAQGFFDVYVLLANPQTIVNTATVTFLREDAPPVVRTYELPPTSRTNVFAGDIPELVNRAFGIRVSFTEPGAAERSMYFGTSPFWTGGHASSGVVAPARSWWLAEGATGPFFDTFVLVANPNPTPATVTFTYLLPEGDVITRQVTMAADSRYTVNIEQEDDRLRETAVSTRVTSDVPVIVERAMYWPGAPATWTEGHNSAGITDTGTRWGIADGRVGGAREEDTFLLVANPTPTPARVTVSYLRTIGAPIVESYDVPPTSRFTIRARDVSGLKDEAFSAVLTSTVPIVVERATYWNAQGRFWAAGTSVTATRLP